MSSLTYNSRVQYLVYCGRKLIDKFNEDVSWPFTWNIGTYIYRNNNKYEVAKITKKGNAQDGNTVTVNVVFVSNLLVEKPQPRKIKKEAVSKTELMACWKCIKRYVKSAIDQVESDIAALELERVTTQSWKDIDNLIAHCNTRKHAFDQVLLTMNTLDKFHKHDKQHERAT